MKKLIFILLLSSMTSARSMGPDSVRQQLQIQLVTIGPGKDMTSWWGHTALIVRNMQNGNARFYNFGIFSFEEENFYTNFAQGRLIFKVDDWRAGPALHYYRNENRDIDIQTLNLSDDQKNKLNAMLLENVKPENRRYLYDHYYDNCSTRIRDLLDEVLGGQFYRDNQGESPQTLRQHTRRHTYHHFWLDWLLMFLMNSSIDEPIAYWDDMFLPRELENRLDSLKISQADGRKVPLVAEKIVFNTAKDFRSVPTDRAPSNIPQTLLLGVLLGVIPVMLALSKKIRRIEFLYAGLSSFVFGILGSVLFYMSLFTDHVVTYGNLNLLLANPLTLLLSVLMFIKLFKPEKFQKAVPLLILILFAFATAGLFLKITTIALQDTWQSLALIYPWLCGLFISVRLKEKNN